MSTRNISRLAIILSATAIVAAAQTAATVDFGTSVQTIRGFGGSTAWMPQLTTAQANSLFGTGPNQLGLSLLRLRIDPGGSANWGTELANAQEAQALGASSIAAVWSPPASMKNNNSTIGGMVNTTSYAAYASYLESFVTYLATGGVKLYAISMQNEPDANVTYESCTWTGAQMDAWVAGNASVLTTKLMMPESESFTTSYSDPALNDANAVGKISIVAGHLYGTSPFYYTNAKNLGKEVWMTEHYLNGSGLSGALALAQEVHQSLTVGDYNAYLWWWIADWPAENYTLGLVDANGVVTPNGYALGQYAKFIRPGYVRTNATPTPSSNIYVSAYKGSGNYVIVALNLGSTAVSQPFTIQNATVAALTPYQTNATQNMAQLSTVSVSGNAFTYTLPPQSITTFTTVGAAPCTTLPSAPSSVTASAASSSAIGVAWGAVTAPANCSTISYNVFRSATSGFTPSSSNQVASGLTAPSYSDTGLTAATTYYYKVEAIDADGASAASAQASAKTLAAPSFTLSASPANLSLTQGGSITDTITVTRAPGFTGTITLSASGQPNGVTPSFNPNPATATSVLTLTATSAAATGSFPVTVTGTSGNLVETAPIGLSVYPITPPSPCHVAYSITNQWQGGFQAAVTITNTGTAGISGWTLTWPFANGQTVSQLWNGTETQSGATVTVTNMSYNGTIPAGGSYNGMGFTGTWNNATNAVPTSFSLNGTACK